MLPKFLNLIKSNQYNIFLVICTALIASISYNMGLISSKKPGKLKVEEGANIYSTVKAGDSVITVDEQENLKMTPSPLDVRVVASKNSDKYHYTWCASADRIKEENKLWFKSDKAAEALGYTLAGNCNK